MPTVKYSSIFIHRKENGFTVEFSGNGIAGKGFIAKDSIELLNIVNEHLEDEAEKLPPQPPRRDFGWLTTV